MVSPTRQAITSSPDIADVLGLPLEIWREIFLFLDWQQLAALRATSKTHKDAIAEFIEKRFYVNQQGLKPLDYSQIKNFHQITPIIGWDRLNQKARVSCCIELPGMNVAVGYEYGLIFIFSTRSSIPIKRLYGTAPHSSHTISDLYYLPINSANNEPRLISATSAGLRIWCLSNGSIEKELFLLRRDDFFILGVNLATHLILAKAGNSLILWNIQTGSHQIIDKISECKQWYNNIYICKQKIESNITLYTLNINQQKPHLTLFKEYTNLIMSYQLVVLNNQYLISGGSSKQQPNIDILDQHGEEINVSDDTLFYCLAMGMLKDALYFLSYSKISPLASIGRVNYIGEGHHYSLIQWNIDNPHSSCPKIKHTNIKLNDKVSNPQHPVQVAKQVFLQPNFIGVLIQNGSITSWLYIIDIVRGEMIANYTITDYHQRGNCHEQNIFALSCGRILFCSSIGELTVYNFKSKLPTAELAVLSGSKRKERE